MHAPASTYASGAARPSRRAACTPVTDMASVGAIPPTDSEEVPQKPRSRRSAPRVPRRGTRSTAGVCVVATSGPYFGLRGVPYRRSRRACDLRGTRDSTISRDHIPAAPGPGDGLLVATKLHIPALRPERISRPALVSSIREGAHARLILVSAPAGAGKTTLLASWHADPGEHRPFAWLSLDDRDNDPVRFWGGVLAALRTVQPGFGPGIEAALRAPGADIVELAMPLLINSLADLSDAVVLVLDDYHEIENGDIHRSVEFVVDHLPQFVQVAIASRSDPPFALARLRARAELLELRIDDLRLTAAEAAALLNGSMHLGLQERQVRSLQERTEGWAAGLQLVGLSLRDREDADEYITSFTGDDRQIVDYLAAEVIDRQPGETREFLLRSSILERLCGPLCDAVLERQDSSRVLVALEHANLFLIPLDVQRVWYRYHHLFRDLLQHELAIAEPHALRELHQRACRWHVEEGLIAEAIGHATAAGEYPQAAELIASNWLTYVNRGQLETVEAWTGALPAEVADADPRLCLARAWMLLVLGRPGEVEPAVRAAEQGTAPGPMRDGSRSIESSAAMVRTSARLLLGDVGGAAETAALAARLEPDTAAPWRPIVTNALGMTAYWSGATGDALEAFTNTVAAAGIVGNHTAKIYALGYLATIAAERSQYDEARRLVDDALTLAQRQDLAEHWVTVMVHYAAGRCARADGDDARARDDIEHGLEIARRGGLRLDTVYGLLALMPLARDRDAARDIHERAQRQLAACADPGILAQSIVRAGLPAGRSRAAASDAERSRERPAADDLSERELAVLRLMPSQLSLREIGNELYVSFNTVKTHSRNIYAKLRVGGRAEAVARASELNLI
jgi:LuxR family maltose regulon positive regulatory protein